MGVEGFWGRRVVSSCCPQPPPRFPAGCLAGRGWLWWLRLQCCWEEACTTLFLPGTWLMPCKLAANAMHLSAGVLVMKQPPCTLLLFSV